MERILLKVAYLVVVVFIHKVALGGEEEIPLTGGRLAGVQPDIIQVRTARANKLLEGWVLDEPVQHLCNS